MNPLWEPLEIPSGKSITDMIRAIRYHIEKIKKYSNLIAAYRRREEFKTNVWDTEEKRLKYVDTVAENLEIHFTSSTYSPGFLAFLVCSHPIDFFMRRRMSLPPKSGDITRCVNVVDNLGFSPVCVDKLNVFTTQILIR